MSRPFRYRRLARSSLGSPSGSLWLGDDHLLHVRHHTAEDRYRRFYFKDIQRIHIARTRMTTLKAVLLVALLALILLSMTATNSTAWRIFLGFPAVLLLLLLVVLAARGPACNCWIRTAIGEMRLRAPNRLRPALALLRTVQPLIEAAQADILAAPLATAPGPPAPAASVLTQSPPGAIDAQIPPVSSAAAPGIPAPSAPPSDTGSPAPPPLPPVNPSGRRLPPPLPGQKKALPGTPQAVLCLLLAGFGLALGLLMIMPSLPLLVAVILAGLVFVVGMVVLLIRQPRGASSIVKFNRGLIAAGSLVAIQFVAISWLIQFETPSQPLQERQVLQQFAGLTGQTNPFVRGLGLTAALMGVTQGIAGLIILGFMNRNGRRQP